MFLKSLRTEETYVYWVKKFVHFHELKHPRDMGQVEIGAWVPADFWAFDSMRRGHMHQSLPSRPAPAAHMPFIRAGW
nr:phage integrase N-terminal SAM-like domain-containing protein [Rhodoferax sp.]